LVFLLHHLVEFNQTVVALDHLVHKMVDLVVHLLDLEIDQTSLHQFKDIMQHQELNVVVVLVVQMGKMQYHRSLELHLDMELVEAELH
jgi:hypothetical protein